MVTAISSVAINNDNTLAVYASAEKKDQIRIIHLPTMTVYSNWPAPKEGLNFIRDLSISGDNRRCTEEKLMCRVYGDGKQVGKALFISF